MTQGVDLVVFGLMAAVFVAITLALGAYGYKQTKNSSEDFLLGRKKTNPILIALSYGATFLSASAVIGFGGQAAVHGLSLMWLCFLNIFVGIIVAFLVFGKRTRRLGKKHGAATFAELLGKVYDSKSIRIFTAVLILVMMPIYAAAVLKGGVNSLAALTGLTEFYDYILIGLALIVGVYVVYGGLIAVMYNDALQAAIMFIGMAVILVVTFLYFGGVGEAFGSLDALWYEKIGVPGQGVLEGFNGWTSTADFGSKEWMTVFTTFVMGVGIGALTQPQLAVRFMTAKSDEDLDKSILIGSIFMLVIVGTAYTVGPLSNVFFQDTHGMAAFEYLNSLNLGIDFIIPQYILEIFSGTTFGDLFISLFLLSLVCASVSTISALMHTIGGAGGHDLYRTLTERKGTSSDSVKTTRITIAIMMILVVVYCYIMPKDIIAKATSIFMGMTAAALLPAYFHALYSKKPNRKAAVCSIAVGTIAYLIMALFFNSGLCIFLPVCEMLTGQAVLFPDSIIAYADPLLIALPLSILTMATVLLLDKRFNAVQAESGAA